MIEKQDKYVYLAKLQAVNERVNVLEKRLDKIDSCIKELVEVAHAPVDISSVVVRVLENFNLIPTQFDSTPTVDTPEVTDEIESYEQYGFGD